MSRENTYTIVEDSHYRLFLKEEGYGHLAELLVNPEGEVSVRRMNKGVDMPSGPLIDIAEELLRQRAPQEKTRAARDYPNPFRRRRS